MIPYKKNCQADQVKRRPGEKHNEDDSNQKKGIKQFYCTVRSLYELSDFQPLATASR